YTSMPPARIQRQIVSCACAFAEESGGLAMRASFVITLLLLVTAFVMFMRTLARAEPLPALGADNQLLAPILYKQLALFPVVRRTSAPSTQYLTLSEGVKKKLVMVTEQGQGGSVNRVQVKNQSEKPLLLLGGEVILGGQQDRILGKDTIVPAHESMVVEVF